MGEPSRQPAALVFGLRVKAGEPQDFDDLRRYSRRHKLLSTLVPVVQQFPEILADLSRENPELASRHDAGSNVALLTEWISGDDSSQRLFEASSPIVTLPLVLLIHLAQYFNYLDVNCLSHAELAAQIRSRGGIQAYCGGLFAALAIAASKDEEQIVAHAAVSLRLTFIVAVYGLSADDPAIPGATMVVIRLKQPGQADELIKRFPGTSIAAVTDPRSITFGGPPAVLASLCDYARSEGMHMFDWPMRGKWHNHENQALAQTLEKWCAPRKIFHHADASSLQVPVRSNRNGELITEGNLTTEIIYSSLASTSNWHQVLINTAKDLKRTGPKSQTVVTFGIGDCTPLVAFNEQGVHLSKVDAFPLFQNACVEDENDMSRYSPDDIAVVGASLRLPGANNLEELWDLLARGTDMHTELPSSRIDLHNRFRATQAESFVKGRKFFANLLPDIDSFDNNFFRMNGREALAMDPQQRIILELAYEAMESSGYLKSHRREDGDRVACFIGAGAIDYFEHTSAHGPSAYTATGTIQSFISGRISHHFGWTGPSEVINTACSSSLVAIHRACQAIKQGDCDMAVAGGVNVMTSANSFLDLSRADFLSPTGQCKPFDSNADGYCRSDGAGLVVLKRLSEAIADSDQILGLIPASATNQGSLSSSITVPHGDAQVSLYENVIQRARMHADDVSYIEAHGTGTRVGDPIEMESIRKVFGSPSKKDVLHVGSIKGNIGHCETAAGVAGVLKALVMINKGRIPPQANFKFLNSKIPALESNKMAISTQLKDWRRSRRAALVNSYGASGSNSALIVCSPPATKTARQHKSEETMTYPIMLSAASKTSLDAYRDALATYLCTSGNLLTMRNIAFTLNAQRKQYKFRLALKAGSVESLSRSLSSGSYEAFECSSLDRPVVLTFSGQSRNHIGVSRSLYDKYPLLQTKLSECNEILINLGYPSIFPSVFQTEAIEDPVLLQSCMVSSQIAFAHCWLETGIKVKAVVGHSLGELAALAVSGVLSLKDCLKLVAGRAQLMKTKWGSEKGKMLVVQATDLDNIKTLVRSANKELSADGKLEIACYNSPTSCVVVGGAPSIAHMDHSIRSMSTPGVKSQLLDVAYGFHSDLVLPLLPELKALSAELEWRFPRIPLEFCQHEQPSTGTSYDPCKHARDPVYFMDAIRRTEARFGGCVWLEAGTNTPVIPMVERALGNPTIHTLISISNKETSNDSDAVTDAVLKMWRSGLNATSWSSTHSTSQPIWLPPYQFEKSKHWLPNVDRAAEAYEKMQAALKEAQPTTSTIESIPTPQLVVMATPPAKDGSSGLFRIDTKCERFQEVVSGHRVRSRPMVPSALYMECALMGLQLLTNESSAPSVRFEHTEYNAPLGLNSARTVQLSIERQTISNKWSFAIQSSNSPTGNDREVLHATGTMIQNVHTDYSTLQRLVGDKFSELDEAEDTETLKGLRAYRLFDQVVQYSQTFKGISKIVLGSKEAIADVTLPSDQPGVPNTTVRATCDTIMMDVFVQVVGILVNSSELVQEGEVMVGAGIEEVCFSNTCNLTDVKPWKVYAKYAAVDGSQAIGDVLVYTHDGKLVGMINGCRFSKISTSRLEKLLDSANNPPRPNVEAVREIPIAVSSTASSSLSQTPQMTPMTVSEPDEVVEKITIDPSPIRGVLAMFIGAQEDDLPDDVTLMELGLDSLAAREMATELETEYGVIVDPMNLQDQTLQSLCGQRTQPSQSTPSHTAKVAETVSQTNSVSKTQKPSPANDGRLQKLFGLLSDYSGCTEDDFQDSCMLAEIGIDSLATMELKQEVEELFALRVDDDALNPDSTIGDLKKALGLFETATVPASVDDSKRFLTQLEDDHQKTTASDNSDGLQTQQSSAHNDDSSLPNPLDVLAENDKTFEASAQRCGFDIYWSDVATDQNELLLAYLVEAYRSLNVDFACYTRGQSIPSIEFKPKYSKVVQRYWDILEQHHVVEKRNGVYVRGARDVNLRPSAELLTRFNKNHPIYKCESDLMELTGSKLADCLVGKADPISCLYGNAKAWTAMEDFYHLSPMLAATTEQLASFVTKWTQTVKSIGDAPLRILEVGAGTGGTAKRVAKELMKTGLPVEYTFTDISPSLLRRAKRTFAEYKWMDYEIFDFEKPVPEKLRHRYDLVFGTNCVHATSDRAAVMKRIGETLRPNGFIVVSETTRLIDWADIVFGLLDGWWLGENGTAYPLQPEDVWMQYFKNAGYSIAGYSQGPSKESNTQRLLIAGNGSPQSKALSSPSLPVSDGKWKVQTVAYKVVDGVEIEADIYLPRTPPAKPMALALLVHGGGCFYLSKRSTRPKQIAWLLSHSILPISVNYRLCPESDVLSGAITDIRDSYIWAQTKLPSLLRSKYDVRADPSNISLIGYSSGGYLAMTAAWSLGPAGFAPPRAIVSFYGPVIFSEPSALDDSQRSFDGIPERRLPWNDILRSLPAEPVTEHELPPGSDRLWFRSGEPRAEMVLSVFRESVALPLMLNSIPCGQRFTESGKQAEEFLQQPAPELVRQVCPLAQLRAGRYTAPTYFVHGDEDEIAPYEDSVKLYDIMKSQGIDCGMLKLKGKKHLHDVHLEAGTPEWKEQVEPALQFIVDRMRR